MASQLEEAMSTDNAGAVGSGTASAEQRARRRLLAEKSFYVHLATYVIVISALFVINALTGAGRWWFVWPAIGWGIGLTIHALSAFGMIGLLGRDWEERRLKELTEEEQRRRA
jgi:hypothetical protein